MSNQEESWKEVVRQIEQTEGELSKTKGKERSAMKRVLMNVIRKIDGDELEL